MVGDCERGLVRKRLSHSDSRLNGARQRDSLPEAGSAVWKGERGGQWMGPKTNQKGGLGECPRAPEVFIQPAPLHQPWGTGGERVPPGRVGAPPALGAADESHASAKAMCCRGGRPVPPTAVSPATPGTGHPSFLPSRPASSSYRSTRGRPRQQRLAHSTSQTPGSSMPRCMITLWISPAVGNCLLPLGQRES